LEDDSFVAPCPHCGLAVCLPRTDLACCIFRHGVYRANSLQINPHASKDECDALAASEAIYGCGKPFRFVKNGERAGHVEECDYI
jgi:hypothetical protein